MRPKFKRQRELDFQPSNLKVTNEFFEKYESISAILDANPKIIDLVHRELKEALECENSRNRDEGNFEYTTETVVRIAICQTVENLSLRETVVRIDDSHFLRRFVRIDGGPMMDFTTFCKLRNCISEKTWEKVNRALAQYAIEEMLIEGDSLRIDSTAVETNIHWPTDSSLLWDTYRVLGRFIEQARELDPKVVGTQRLQTRRVKRLHAKIARKATKKPGSQERLRPLYERQLQYVLDICQWAEDVRQNLERKKGRSSELVASTAEYIAEQIAHYRHLGLRVIDQASRRVLDGEQVPNDDKIFSIFEPHTELIKRGKAGKDVEFGHMVQIQQVAGKFITDYKVFDRKPVEHELIRPALDSHKKLFGEYPEVLAADKGYYASMEVIDDLSREIEMVSIAKKGKRTEEEALREADADFRAGQRFRAGAEGTISFLRRGLGLARCFSKGWEHYASAVGATIFAHNLLILARA